MTKQRKANEGLYVNLNAEFKISSYTMYNERV